MTDSIQDDHNPLKYLNLKKKREKNKANLDKIKGKQKTGESFIIPSFASINSLDQHASLFKK